MARADEGGRSEGAEVSIGLNAVIIAVTGESPRVLVVGDPAQQESQPHKALPSGPLDPELDLTLEKGLRGWVLEQTGLELGYVEQLYTFGDLNRVPPSWSGSTRFLSIAYLALVREAPPSTSALHRSKRSSSALIASLRFGRRHVVVPAPTLGAGPRP